MIQVCSNTLPSKLKVQPFLLQHEWDFCYSRVPRLCVDAIIRRPEGVLLTLRTIEPWKGLWHLPGGTVRRRESLFAALKRIVHDEVGLEVVQGAQIGVMQFLDPRAPHVVSLAYEVEATGNSRPSLQGSCPTFFKSPPDAMIQEQRDFLSKYLEQKPILA